MHAKTWSLGEILKPERRYIIPTFQRSYEWTRDAQWELLFEDLASTASRLFDVREFAERTEAVPDEERVAPHFLGAVVCDTLPFPAGGVALRSVIDGQQRLTTVQLLIRGLLDVVLEGDQTGALRGKAKALRKMISNDEDSGAVPEDVYKLWPRRDDRAYWPALMEDAVPAYRRHDHPYLLAREYFAHATREYLEDFDGDTRDQRLRALVDAVDTLFQIVVIDLDKNDDAQVIFEVLNGRQTKLSASDLVKNLIFLRAEFARTEQLEAVYDLYWSQFDDAWWKERVGTGHAQRGRRDVLLSVWLTATTGSEVTVGNLYSEVRRYLDTRKPQTEALLRDLSQFAQAYREVYGALAVSDVRLRTAYSRLVELGILTAVPLLAWLRTLPEDQLSLADQRTAVLAVESFTVRRMIGNWATRNYGATFVRALKNAKDAAPGEIAVAIVDALESAGWPSDAELGDALRTSNFFRLAAFRKRLVLGALDDRMRADDRKQAPAVIDYGRLQVEHILPQAWKEHWPLPAELDEVERLHASSERDLALNRIGNLTLVTQHFNGSVSNLGWDHKRPEFAKQSSVMLNVPIAAEVAWSEESIRARGEVLSEVAARVWPRPEGLLGGS
ncbi:DUF262 domain-containing protein [Demequina sp. NBRC 110053]|uniref:DUF262 domain-containing protein n=1 Tax=Demequina sp. NBRC 110053 TaxID=1570342 RepID=UPI0009FFF09C|nr:DUF262 domain-containing protein [Demequina sp. NBRC 110053]